MDSSTVASTPDAVSLPEDRFFGLSRQQLLEMYRLMFTSRRLDDKEIAMRKMNEAFFQISGAGHEAVLVAAGMVFKPGYDWFYLYYRDRALCLTLGMTELEILMQATGAADDPNSGGRRMPSHWGSVRLNIPSSSSPTGTQFLQSVGCAEAGRYMEQLSIDGSWHKDEVVLVTTGDGTTSQGEFWEAISTACVRQLPVIFLVEDNGFAISVPVEVQTPGSNIAKAMSGLEGLRIIDGVDGTDPVSCYGVWKDAISYVRTQRAPILMRAKVTRPYSHSLSDDHAMYRPATELEEERQRDCLNTFPRYLVQEGLATEAELDAIRKQVNATVDKAGEDAIRAPKPDNRTVLDHVYSDTFDMTSSELDRTPVVQDPKPQPMGGLINRAMLDEMSVNPKILVFGEDVADATHEDVLDECKGKGGVFKVTYGLQRKFGATRVFNSPLAEANILGRAIGMATRGLKPVVEVQFFDYIWTAMMQIRDELSMMRHRSNGMWKCPLVVRVAIGGYLRGGAIYHSQCGESIFAHCPGLRVAFPSNAQDAHGLLRTAIRGDDPVLFLEHKHLYFQGYNRAPYPGADFTVPFGKARTARTGKHLTLITYGATVERSLKAAKQAEAEGIEVEVLDLRTVSPVDWDAIAASVRRTNRALVVHEDQLTCGFGAELAAWIGEHCFEWLDAPVRRIAALDCPVAYAPNLEELILPHEPHILDGIRALKKY